MVTAKDMPPIKASFLVGFLIKFCLLYSKSIQMKPKISSLFCLLYRDYSQFQKANITKAERKVNDLGACDCRPWSVRILGDIKNRASAVLRRGEKREEGARRISYFMPFLEPVSVL